ncbi:MAG: 2-hydroxyacyl-CoA dehydratase family protein, partial [Deltaproteobacteria bacterium]|nr:2-hydroxyacyl-CoA dehydratase family protein [Deltaproteobacteria bacterium]
MGWLIDGHMLYIKSDMNIPSIEDIISKSKAENKKIALVFPIYYPSALLRTFDIHPFEIWNAPYADLSLADSHIQSYTCSLGRILLSFVKDKRYRENYDLIFIPHICDTFQQIGSLLNDFIKAEKPVINFYLPKRNDESGIIFCTEELKRIVKILEDICGRKFDNNRFLSELEKDYEINNLIREAYLKREYLNISDYEFYRIITSRSFLPAEDFIKLLNDLLSDKSERQRASGKKIFISGISAEPPEIFQVINNTGASVVFDDLAVSGRRVFQIPPPSAEPFRRQSEIMLYT